MKKYIFYFLIIFLVLSFIYALIAIQIEFDSRVFLTIATFAFAIFAGFFLQRQGQRYGLIRDKITAFDGDMSFLYRSFGHFGPEVQNKMGEILKRHYSPIIQNKSWAYPFLNKTTTIIDINNLIHESVNDSTVSKVQGAVLGQMFSALKESQIARKNMIALYQEKIPFSQWILIYFLAIILLITLTLIFSDQLIGALLKGSFGSIIIFTLIMLRKFDKLEFFEGLMGEHSAQDVLDIMGGNR